MIQCSQVARCERDNPMEDTNEASSVRALGQPRSEAAKLLERTVLGHEVGTSGFTTVEQAARLSGALQMSPGKWLLDLGAGRGWPGSHIAVSTRCHVVSSDISDKPLREAGCYARARGVAPEHILAVSFDGRALPFAPGTFDGISHADVFC